MPGTATPHKPLVLVTEDDPDIRKFLAATLKGHGFAVLEAATGAAGLALCREREPDAVILDLGLPDMDGRTVIARIRSTSQVPVIILSARAQEDDKIEALNMGADDYLTKPFSAGELVARIGVALRHAGRRNVPDDDVFERNGLRIVFDAHTVEVDGQDVRLTPTEFRLLALFARNAGRVLTHRQLLKDVWGRYSDDNHHYVRIHTQHLREKLGDDPLAPRFISTEPGIGYRFNG